MSVSDKIFELAKHIKLVIFDVDGVLTDGGLYFADDGTEFKRFNVKDGLGLSCLAKTDVTVAIITGRNSPIVTERMKSLGISHVYQGKMNKIETYKKLLADLGLEPEQAAYIGDDIIDLPIMVNCGLPVAVADAHEDVLKIAKWVTKNGGGKGAGRELCDLIMAAQGNTVDFAEFSQ